jgi:uncharacterized protein with von Willebrand factor type A (vWA) domain
MFSGFFYALRDVGLPVSLNEWLTLTEAISLGLAEDSLTEYYYLARSLLVKSEAAFDKYDAAFIRYFGEDADESDAPPNAVKKPERSYKRDFFDPARYDLQAKPGPDPDPGEGEGPGALADSGETVAGPRLTEAEDGSGDDDESDNGDGGGGGDGGDGAKRGSGTGHAPGEGGPGGGDTNYDGATGSMTAIKIAGQRRYKDYQDDRLMSTRQYEIALRSLRQLSSKLEGPKDELNLDATIEETGLNNGMLSLEWERPRKNALKVLVLMDSIGSIYSHFETCKKLFNAAHRSTHFKEIKFYYFHNCIYGRIYKTQWLDIRESLPTEDFFRLHNGDWRVLIVGDAQMGEQELTKVGGVIDWSAEYNSETGLTWLNRFARHFPYTVWLNPVPEHFWNKAPNYASIPMVGEVFPMFELTPGGIEKAVKRLRVRS